MTAFPESDIDLLAGQAPPFEPVNQDGQSEVVLICEHAGRRIPPALNGLGIAAEYRSSHIIWDIGARGLALKLSEKLDAALAMQRYSRLVYDCNRDWGAHDEVPAKIDYIDVPGNRDLTVAQRQLRRNTVYTPFRDGTRRLIDYRLRHGRVKALVTVHSFTPVFGGQVRDLDIGIIHDSDKRLADIMLSRTAPRNGLDIRRNEPYSPSRGVTHTLKVHGIARGLPNVMIEIRNDHIVSDAGQSTFAGLVADWIQRSVDQALLAAGSDL